LLLTGSLVAAVAGAGLVVTSSGGLAVTAAGVGFALAAALTFSLYLIGADVVLKRTPPLVASMWVSGSASVALAVVAVAGGGGRLPHGLREWGAVLGMGAFTAGAFTSLFVGLRRLGAVRTSIVAALEPVAASVMAFLILGEPLRPGTVLGGVLILAGAVAATLARAAKPAVAP
jgi:drug/metabolite transporter (DMT)-like permease